VTQIMPRSWDRTVAGKVVTGAGGEQVDQQPDRRGHPRHAASQQRTGAMTGLTRTSSMIRTPAGTGPPTWPTIRRCVRPT